MAEKKESKLEELVKQLNELIAEKPRTTLSQCSSCRVVYIGNLELLWDRDSLTGACKYDCVHRALCSDCIKTCEICDVHFTPSTYRYHKQSKNSCVWDGLGTILTTAQTEKSDDDEDFENDSP